MRLILLLCVLCVSCRAFPVQIRDTTALRNDAYKPLPPFYVPKGAKVVSKGKTVTSSDDFPIIGTLSMITDGIKEGTEGNWVELGPGTQWVQIDLGQRSRIYGLHLWHYFGESRAYRDVIVQVCDENTFTKNVRTIYNNDQDNSSGFGKGTEREFYESNQGFRIDTRGKNYEGIVGRFVRLYSRGNTSDPQNQYIEVEVIGKDLNKKPAKSRSEAELVKSGELRPWTFRRMALPANTTDSINITVSASALRPNFLVPKNTMGLGFSEVLSSSDPQFTVAGKNNFFYKSAQNRQRVTLATGLQWIQIDLTQIYYIYAIQLWHDFAEGRAYEDVIVRVADDALFTKNVRTLFNNDADNSAHLGIGKDKPYVETGAGLILDTRGKNYRGTPARYIRFYSRGNNKDEINQYADIEVAYATVTPCPTAQTDLMLWKTSLPSPPYTNR